MKKLSIILASLLLSIPVFAGEGIPNHLNQEVRITENGYQVIKPTMPTSRETIGPAPAGQGTLNVENRAFYPPWIWAETEAWFDVDFVAARVTIYNDDGVVQHGRRTGSHSNYVDTSKITPNTFDGRAEGYHEINKSPDTGWEYATTEISF